MWGLVAESIGGIVRGWVDLKKSKYESEAAFNRQLAQQEGDWDAIAQKQSQYSIKDELITIVWLMPLVAAWFDEAKAQQWVDFASDLPMWYQFGLFGIVAASFGLRWWFKQQNFKLTK